MDLSQVFDDLAELRLEVDALNRQLNKLITILKKEASGDFDS